MKNKKQVHILILAILIIFIVGGYFIYRNVTKKTDVSNSTTDNIEMSIDTDDGDEDIDWTKYTEEEISLSETLNITKEGIYKVSGTLDDGMIKINTDDNVKLILNNVNITNGNGPAIYVEGSENVVIYLLEGTSNYLEDSSTYTGYDEEVSGVIYSADDIIFDGSGSLEVKSNYLDGIVGKDDLKIINGNYKIDSVDDALRGKDSVYILNGTFNINSGGDAIKSTNDTDGTKGFIKIENGTFDIESELDGIAAETNLEIKNGTFNIVSGESSSNASTSDSWGNWGRTGVNTTSSTESAKGIKSGNNLVIENGIFNLDTSDDSIHSNNYVGIKSGEFNISSGDDGIHADTEIIIDSGNINIEKSYEGIEAAKVTINNGDINIVSSDDGLNIAGGNDGSGMNRPGAGNYNSSADNILTINNGNIYVNASGDGIDVNGSAYIYDGNVTIDGPTNDGNGSLDYDREFVIESGTILTVGSSGMAQSITSSSQNVVNIYLDSNYSSGTKIKIVDSNNNEILNYTSNKTFSLITYSSEMLENGSYTIYLDDEEYKNFQISSRTTNVGSSSSMSGMPSGGGPGRR